MKQQTKQNTRILKPRIPDQLIYEIMDGKPIYYKGYKEVIKQIKQIEEIMGSSSLQTDIIDLILRVLYEKSDRKKYKIRTNELGLYIDEKNNIAADISIFEREKLYKNNKIEAKYEKVPPKIIIEIDTKAELDDFDSIMDYYQIKTQKLFNFGVEKVIWILTKNKQIIEASPQKPQLIHTWDKEIHLFENIKFSINQLLKEDGIFDII